MASLEDFVELTGSTAELAGAAEIWSKLGENEVVTELKDLTLAAIKAANSAIRPPQPAAQKEKSTCRGHRKPVPTKQSA